MSFTPASAEPTDVCSAHTGPRALHQDAAVAARIADIRRERETVRGSNSQSAGRSHSTIKKP